MSEEAPPEKLLDRVRKLVALACDDRAPEPERDAAMSLAQVLMTKHAIDEARLGAVGETTERVVNRVFAMPAPYSKAKAYGFSLVAGAVGLKPVNLPARRNVPGFSEWRLHVFGYESDVEFFDFLLASLMLQMTRDGAQAYDGTGQIFWTSFVTAFCNVVGRRLQDARKAAIAEQPDAPGTDIVLADRTEFIMDARRDAYPILRKGRSVRTGGSGIEAGRDSGARADLGRNRIARNARALKQ
jgi:Protein of unknown function (DUF2786)